MSADGTIRRAAVFRVRVANNRRASSHANNRQALQQTSSNTDFMARKRAKPGKPKRRRNRYVPVESESNSHVASLSDADSDGNPGASRLAGGQPHPSHDSQQPPPADAGPGGSIITQYSGFCRACRARATDIGSVELFQDKRAVWGHIR